MVNTPPPAGESNDIIQHPIQTPKTWARGAVSQISHSLHSIFIEDVKKNSSRSRGVIGKAMDIGTGVVMSSMREAIRLPFVGITRITKDTVNTIGNLLGNTVKLTGRAVVNNLKVIALPTRASTTE